MGSVVAHIQARSLDLKLNQNHADFAISAVHWCDFADFAPGKIDLADFSDFA